MSCGNAWKMSRTPKPVDRSNVAARATADQEVPARGKTRVARVRDVQRPPATAHHGLRIIASSKRLCRTVAVAIIARKNACSVMAIPRLMVTARSLPNRGGSDPRGATATIRTPGRVAAKAPSWCLPGNSIRSMGSSPRKARQRSHARWAPQSRTEIILRAVCFYRIGDALQS